MTYALLLLLPAAPLPPVPARLERKYLAGLEYRVKEPWGGTFCFYKNGNWEHRYAYSGPASWRGSWKLENGIVNIAEMWEGEAHHQIDYHCRVTPDPEWWWTDGRLSGVWWSDGPTTHKFVLHRPRRIKR